MAYKEAEINDLDMVGLILDEDADKIPPEAWTTATNIRFEDGDAKKLEGFEQVFGTPGVAPHFAMFVADPSQAWWLYTSLTKAYVYDGTTHTDITRAVGGDYSAGQTRDWNGTILGGVPILNSGADEPQYWADYSIAQKLQDLPAWPADWTTRVMRAFGPYLLALGPTKTGTYYAHTVNWSHPADPGSLPDSWDVGDPTKDAGELALTDVDSGVLLDGLPLRGNMILYKESSTWILRITKGIDIMEPISFLETSGILAPRCVTVTPDGSRQFVATQDDVIVHNGQGEPTSVVEGRLRKTIFNELDSTNYLNSFTFTNAARQECWFCYPESGAVHPTKALVWNAKSNAVSFAEVAFRNASVGAIDIGTSEVWDSDTDVWDSDLSPWQVSQRRKVVLCDPANTKMYLLDVGETHDGVDFIATLQRTALALIGRKRNGDPIEDWVQRKSVRRLWINAEGGPIDVRMGFLDLIKNTVRWTVVKSFNPATQMYLDFEGSGRALAVEFSSSSAVRWKLVSYKIELGLRGKF